VTLALHKDTDTHKHAYFYIHGLRTLLHWGGMKRQPKPFTQTHAAQSFS